MLPPVIAGPQGLQTCSQQDPGVSCVDSIASLVGAPHCITRHAVGVGETIWPDGGHF